MRRREIHPVFVILCAVLMATVVVTLLEVFA
jgi:hypothetical protein